MTQNLVIVLAILMVESLSGSAGVIVPPVGYLQRLPEICDQHDILLIFDEVITAFDRFGAGDTLQCGPLKGEYSFNMGSGINA